MMEWASDEVNGAWAERVKNRSFETENINTPTASTLYDAFTGSVLDRSKWTPMSLDTTSTGTIIVSGSNAAITQSVAGRFGIMSNPLLNTRFATVSVETKLVSYTGVNGLLDIYGGTGPGDFSHFVEFGIEGGIMKVFADGVPIWSGASATTPAILRVDVGSLEDQSRTFSFYYNGTLVHTLSGFNLMPEFYRVMLYGWDGTATFDYLSVTPDNTYDAFGGTTVSSRWVPTTLEGSGAGSLAVGGGALNVTGAAATRFGALSDFISNSSTDFTTIEARLNSYSGQNGLLNIYGGTGSGDFSHFVEFGVEGGVAKVFTSSAAGNWVGPAVSLPATLSVLVSPWWSNGRLFRFFINGNMVYELPTQFEVPESDYRLFLYGYGATSTHWDYINISQTYMVDRWDSGFEAPGGLAGTWAPSTLEGGWGTSSQSSSELVINGAASSRYGIMSPPMDQSDIYGYTIEARLDTYSGTNALLNIYAGSGRGDFSHYVEFGVEAGVLRVFGDGIPAWTGAAVSTPIVLRIEVGPWTNQGRNIYFFANNRLVYGVEGFTAITDAEYHAFIYGWGTSVTKWDYLTWWKTIASSWKVDGNTDVGTVSRVRNAAFNGSWSQRVTVTTHTTGRKGISQGDMSVIAGHPYQVSMYLKQSGLVSQVVVVLGPDVGDSPTYIAYATATLSGISGSWVKYTTTLTPTTTDSMAKLLIAATGTGTLDIDMVSVMPTDPSEVSLGGWRTDFVQALQDLQPNSLRWPGGIISDSYHWQDGIGNRDLRPPQYYGQWNGEWMSNDVGTDEVLNLAEYLDIPVLLNINWGGGGTPTEAANWVEYTNAAASTHFGALRAANGHTDPWGVHTWEIGNEVWGSWTAGHTDPATYAASFNIFQAAMAAVDPTIEFIGEGGDGTTSDQTWNSTVLGIAANNLDHLSIHYYSPQPLPQGYNSANVYIASVAAPVTIESRMDATRNTILTSTTQDIKIAVTEHNAMYFNEENNRARTLEGALQEAGLLNLFMRESNVNEINAASTLVNFWDGSAIRLGPRGILVTPTYLVQKLISIYHGSLLLSASVTSGTYSAPAMGNLPAQPAVPYLDVAITRSPDGLSTYISVVNRDPSTAHVATISLSNAGTIGSVADTWVVGSANYLDQNTWQNPTQIQISHSGISGVGSSFAATFPPHSFTVIALETTASSVTGPQVIGQVTDSHGVPVSGATVTLAGGGAAITDSQGYYCIPATAGMTYSMAVSAPGFTTYTRHAIEVTEQGASPLPVRLA